MKIFTTLKKNKYLRLFNKKYLFMLTRFKTLKLLVTAKQLIRKNSICCLKNQAIFSQSERAHRLDNPLPLFVFVHLLRAPYPLHSNCTF